MINVMDSSCYVFVHGSFPTLCDLNSLLMINECRRVMLLMEVKFLGLLFKNPNHTITDLLHSHLFWVSWLFNMEVRIWKSYVQPLMVIILGFCSVVHLNIHFWSKFMLAALSVVLESFTNRCVKFVNWSSRLMIHEWASWRILHGSRWTTIVN